jgi:hypothetical protein
MEWECIKELVSNQHCVNAICHGDIVNGVMPMDFQAVFAICYVSMARIAQLELDPDCG